LRSSFSGGGKVEASPLSPEIVSTDARFVPRMFKKAPILDKDLVQGPCFFNLKWTSKKREIPSREQHRKPRTHYSLCFSLQMQHNSIVVIDKLAAKLYPSAAEVTSPAPLHLYDRREEDLVGIFCLVLPCEHDELNHHRFPIHHESLAGIITQPNRKKCRGTYL